MKRRERVFIMSPTDYEISCNLCDGSVEWSEYEHFVWCWRCLKDVPGNPGLFCGPISIELCKLLGISLDKIDLKTGKRLYIKVKEENVVWEARK